MNIMSNHCASCGKADANLKACKACKLMICCGVECQMAHQSANKKTCIEKARELFDQKLYAQPPRQEECPICMITMSCRDDESSYLPCCGKTLCNGCVYRLPRACCPFCNAAYPTSHEAVKQSGEVIKRLFNRIEKYNDPEAMIMLSDFYRSGHGRYGIPVDRSKEIELLQHACELGSASGHFDLGTAYMLGDGTEIDIKTAEAVVHHWQIAAMMGNVSARNNLGILEFESGNLQRAMRHFMIAAKCGFQQSLNNVKQGFKNGHVTKEDFEKTLRDYQAACDETKSEQRDRAAAKIAQEGE